MTDYIFPERRFVEAGVPGALVDRMRREFTASDLTIRRALCDFWNPLSASALRDYASTYTGEVVESPVVEDEVASESTENVPSAPLSAPNVEDDESTATDVNDDPEASEGDEA